MPCLPSSTLRGPIRLQSQWLTAFLKIRNLNACKSYWSASAKFSAANYEKRVGKTLEVMVEGKNEARGQLMGRTSQSITLNFTAPPESQPAVGSYANVRVTKSFPNSLVGELVQEGHDGS